MIRIPTHDLGISTSSWKRHQMHQTGFELNIVLTHAESARLSALEHLGDLFAEVTISALTLSILENSMQRGATSSFRNHARLRQSLINTGGGGRAPLSSRDMRLVTSCPYLRVASDSFEVSLSNRACFSNLLTLFSLRHLPRF